MQSRNSYKGFLKLKQIKTILFCKVGGGATRKVCRWDSLNIHRKAQYCIEDKTGDNQQLTVGKRDHALGALVFHAIELEYYSVF